MTIPTLRPSQAQRLTAEISAVAPIFGVSIGDRADKSTWRIDFDSTATTEQRKAAQAVVDAFDWQAAEQDASTETAIEEKLAVATGVLLGELLTTRAADADAPQEIKDWKAASAAVDPIGKPSPPVAVPAVPVTP